MHGIILKGLKDYVVETHGQTAWDDTREQAAVDMQVYLPIKAYPDEDFFALADAAASETDQPKADLLEGFGHAVASQLLTTYGGVVDADWDALDVVEHAERAVHSSLREHNDDLNPPDLTCVRETDDVCTVQYDSEKGMCAVARGIILGVGNHYDEPLLVQEEACTLDGDDQCELEVTLE